MIRLRWSFSTVPVCCRVVAVVALSLTAACGGSNRAAPKFLSIATGGTGGVYYPYGGAIARLLTEKIPGVQATAEVTGASVDNLKLIQVGKVDLAFTLADTLAEAVHGTGPFAETGAIGSVRTLAVLYTNYTHVIVRQGTGITSVAGLKGHSVSVGSPGSGTELIADRVLQAAGLNPRADITRQSLGVTESAGALKDGKLDAFFWSGGVPTPAIQDLAATPGTAIVFLAQVEALQSLQQQYGRDLYRLAVIPATAYRGMSTDINVIGVPNLLVASSSVDEALAFDIVRVMFENKAALVAAHPEAAHLGPPTSPTASPAPFHAGAIKYYAK